MAQVFVLLKNFSKNGLVKFHGVANSVDVATTWQNAGPSHWYFEYDSDDSSVCALLPITYDRMNDGEIE